MRLNPGNTTRTSYYDRSAVARMSGYASTEAPHASTDRITYTVPAGFNAILEMTHLVISRATAAAPSSLTACRWKYTPNGATGYNIVHIREDLAAVNNSRDSDQVPVSWMDTGDTLIFQTSDGSTGGTIFYEGTCKLTEFAV